MYKMLIICTDFVHIKNKNIQRYRLTTEEILQAVEKINQANIKTVVLQSGEEIFEEDFICDLIIKIKKSYRATFACRQPQLNPQPKEYIRCLLRF